MILFALNVILKKIYKKGKKSLDDSCCEDLLSELFFREKIHLKKRSLQIFIYSVFIFSTGP